MRTSVRVRRAFSGKSLSLSADRQPAAFRNDSKHMKRERFNKPNAPSITVNDDANCCTIVVYEFVAVKDVDVVGGHGRFADRRKTSVMNNVVFIVIQLYIGIKCVVYVFLIRIVFVLQRWTVTVTNGLRRVHRCQVVERKPEKLGPVFIQENIKRGKKTQQTNK